MKPALPVRRISSQNAAGEKSPLQQSSTQSLSTSHSRSARTNSTQLPKSSSKPPSAVSATVGEESSVVQPNTPPVTTHAATRWFSLKAYSTFWSCFWGYLFYVNSVHVVKLQHHKLFLLLCRLGRKPKGFLSFMSSKNVSGTTTTRPPHVKSTQSRTMLTAPRTISPETELAITSSSSNRTTCGTGNAVLITPSYDTHSWVSNQCNRLGLICWLTWL